MTPCATGYSFWHTPSLRPFLPFPSLSPSLLLSPTAPTRSARSLFPRYIPFTEFPFIASSRLSAHILSQREFLALAHETSSLFDEYFLFFFLSSSFRPRKKDRVRISTTRLIYSTNIIVRISSKKKKRGERGRGAKRAIRCYIRREREEEEEAL